MKKNNLIRKIDNNLSKFFLELMEGLIALLTFPLLILVPVSIFWGLGLIVEGQIFKGIFIGLLSIVFYYIKKSLGTIYEQLTKNKFNG